MSDSNGTATATARDEDQQGLMVDGEELLDKQSAAAFLGVSAKSVERYCTERILASVLLRRGPQGRMVCFQKHELERFKKLREAPKVNSAVVSQTEVLTERQDHREAARETFSLAVVDRMNGIAEFLVRSFRPQLPGPLMVTEKEAAGICGLSRTFLQRARKGGALKAVRDGGAWRYRREDLVRFVEDL
jgi:hypothetical protein